MIRWCAILAALALSAYAEEKELGSRVDSQRRRSVTERIYRVGGLWRFRQRHPMRRVTPEIVLNFPAAKSGIPHGYAHKSIVPNEHVAAVLWRCRNRLPHAASLA